MTQEEARAVLHLGLEDGSDPGRVRVEDVAETLRISTNEVETLLERVRAQGMRSVEDEMAEHRLRDMRRLMAALAFSVVMVVGGWLIWQSRQPTPATGYPVVSFETTPFPHDVPIAPRVLPDETIIRIR
ncbi:hypothetical protein EON79_14090 [bacterium]|nr:MAG: hypothetical protein EON79_14090 [bacterium]